MVFQRATKRQARLRAAIYGPSGSGKTFTSLELATGLGGPIAVIDTERGGAAMYADRYTFDVCRLEQRRIEDYVSVIADAAATGYAVLIIDSLSHAWHELLQEVDRLAAKKHRGNTWAAWSEGTPKQRSMVEAILSYPGHVLATMRTKTEWVVEKDSEGKSRPTKIGLAPEQGKGIEYEFDVLLEITAGHYMTVAKDRTGRFQDRCYDCPTRELGRELAAWLGGPAAALEPPEAAPGPPEGSATSDPDATLDGLGAVPPASEAVPPADPDLAGLRKLGRGHYGKHWTLKQRELAEGVSRGRTRMLKDLTAAEVCRLVEGIAKVQSGR